MRKEMIAASATDLRGLRDRAMIAVGYDTLCRRAELVALRAEDVKRRPAGGANILVRRAKNDPSGNGRLAALSADAVRSLEAWLAAADIDRGPIFRPIYRDRVLSRGLHACVVSRIVKARAAAANIAPAVVAGLSGHSMRIGCAQDLNLAGHDLLTIMRAGGWRSADIVARYIENVDLRIWD
jgi:integrase/recombinase XerD